MDKITIPNNGQSTEKVKRYTIMFENIPVLEFNIETDEVIVYDKEHLPFGLRGKEKISSAYVLLTVLTISEYIMPAFIKLI